MPDTSPRTASLVARCPIARAAVAALAVVALSAVPLGVVGATPTTDSDHDLVLDAYDRDDDGDGIDDVAECDGSAAATRFVDDAMSGRLGLELRPSMFGLALGQSDVTVERDISDAFGYSANSGAVVAQIEHANRHPTADVFISGVNPVSTGTPTRVRFTGTLGVHLDLRHDVQWFGVDTKTLETHDGTQLTDWYALANPTGADPRFVKASRPGSEGNVRTVSSALTLSATPTIHFTGYSSELAPTATGFRFVSTTT